VFQSNAVALGKRRNYVGSVVLGGAFFRSRWLKRTVTDGVEFVPRMGKDEEWLRKVRCVSGSACVDFAVVPRRSVDELVPRNTGCFIANNRKQRTVV
jgi:hypothetical protein